MLGKGNLKKILAFMPRRELCLPVNATAPCLALLFLLIPTNSFAQWTNEPPGSTKILDCPFSGPDSDCGINDVYNSAVQGSDPSAPVSGPGISVDTLQPFAKTGGSQRSYLFGNNYNEVYMGMMVRTNPEFEGRIVGNKMWFLRGPDSNGVWLLASESRLKPGGSVIFGHNTGGGLDNSHTCAADLGLICYANAGGGYLTKGQWTKLEAYVKKSTTNTSRDGIVRWWINGQLAGNYENMNYAGAGLNEWVWTETWDGAGDMGTSNTVTWNWYFDHLYLSIPNCPDGCKLSGWQNLPPGNPPQLPPGEEEPPPPTKPAPLVDAKTIPLDPTIIYQHLKDVGDFKPHYGLLPIPWPLPFPVVVPQGIGRGLWCYGPVYIYVFPPGVWWCVPIPRNWCYQFSQCFATNTLNLISTLQIKYAWPEGEGRLEKPANRDAMPPDFYTRDMCVSGAKLDYNRFDPKTGKLIVPKVAGTIVNADSSGFDERATGTVIGAKPVINSCMTTIDTPNFDPPTKDAAVFSYYMNATNYPFLSKTGEDIKARNTVYGTSNNYLSTSFFIGSQLGCPERISRMENGKAADGEAWLDAANRCYSWFIYQRATHPEWTLERPGSGADFPLTQDEGRGGNPDLSIFNTCQPLMSGHNSRLVAQGQTPIGKGFSPVLQYDRADLDEADYSPAQEIVQGFGDYFKEESTWPTFHNIFPCMIQPNDAGPNKVTDWEAFNLTLFINYAISFSVEVTVLDLDWGPMYFIPMSNKDSYKSVGRTKPGFCPNVEKIIDPTLPFAPRNDYNNPKDAPDYPGAIARDFKLLEEATLDQFSTNPPNTAEYATDREYSFQTKVFTPRDRIFNDWEFAYSEYNPTMTNPPTADPSVRLESLKYPEVQCGVVPVDIMSWRRKSFDNCIMQRINFNFLTYRRRNFLSYYYKNTLPPWKKPCVTRFWEHDTYDECPVSMSIQQCCRIIVKDVVPLNYLKIRTCEGLRQKRNFIFGFDHLYDYAEKPSEGTVTDENGVVTAASGTPIESRGGKSVRFPLPGEQITGDDLISTAPPANSSSYENNTFSDEDRTRAKEAYNQVYILNQKLSLIGCDDTEPETFRFDHYFLHSELKPIPSNVISESMLGLKDASDTIIREAKEESLQAVLAVFGPDSAAWQGFNDFKTLADVVIEEARKALDEVLEIESVARIRYQNAENNAALLESPQAITSMLLGIIPPDLPFAIGEEFLTSYAELQAAILGTDVAVSVFNEIKATQEQVIQFAETQVKDGVTEILVLQENFVMANAKAFADQMVIDGAETIRSSLGPQFAELVNQSIDLSMSNIISQLAMQELGEGGAHMPYMRWWDTGTSAGNPLHGGSFINTLGSYDTIIGVGHEERDYEDATIPVPDIVEKYDAEEVENATAEVEETKAAIELAKEQLFAAVDEWNNGPNGVPGTPIWFGPPDEDTLIHSADKHVGVSDICYLTPKKQDGNYIDCSQYNQDFPPMQEKIYKLRIALNNAQRKLDIANGVITQDTSETPVTLTFEQSLITPSKMGRISGWDGLKGHQMWTLRRQNFSCIGRYEKIFKPYGPENFVLTRAGASWQTKDGVQWSWPLSWRGYIHDPDNEFEKNIFATGLDNAQSGDIIIFKVNGLKRIYYVSFVNQTDPRYIKIEGWDQGKFPTSTGSGISLGTGVERIIYKNPNDLPEAARKFRPLGNNDPVPPDISSIAEAAKVGNVPSCEDPDYTNCVLGGDGAEVNGEFIANSTWNDVEIYRPSEDTKRRQCPMFNSAKVAGGKVGMDTTKLASDSIAYCINAGFDPPPDYTTMPFNGTGAGNLSDTTLCGLRWGDCSAYVRARKSCFPGNEICVPDSTGSPTPPDELPPGKVDCTAEQLKEAGAAYTADVKAITQISTEAQEKQKLLYDQAQALMLKYNTLQAQSANQIAEQQIAETGTSGNPELDSLMTRLAQANTDLANAQAEAAAAQQDLYNYKEAHKNDIPDNGEDATGLQEDIQKNIEALDAKAVAAQDKVKQAIGKINGLQSLINKIKPLSPALQAQKDATDAELAELQNQIALNSGALADLENEIANPEERPEIPKFTCPYTSSSGQVFGGEAGSQDIEGE